ncbi:MAG: NAD(P)H-binding protein [Bacteroidota bacterium]
MQILLLGATGRTGKWALHHALAAGHQVHCLARNSSRIPPHPRLKVFEGDVRSPEDLAKALAGCTHLISALNVSRRSDFPWAPLRTPATLMSDTMKAVIPLAEAASVERVVICSAWGVGETKAEIPAWFRWFIEHSNIGVAYQDHARQEALLMDSALPGTIVRPVGLTNSTKPQSIRETLKNEPKPNLLISRAALGRFLVESLAREDLLGKRVVVSKN